MNNIKTLDCTFRDGGYYTSWHFDHLLVGRYLIALDSAGVDYVELGYRSLQNTGFFGAFKYSYDSYLRPLKEGLKIKFAVMLDTKELVQSNKSIRENINNIFLPSKDSPIDMVRVAIVADQLIPALEICAELKEKGYETTINLMQISLLKEDEQQNLAQKIGESGVVDVLYFADSFGSMLPTEIPNIVKALSSSSGIPIGVHCHNNLGLGVINSTAAIDAGVNFVDATILGMGRGAGNAETESLLLFLKNLYGNKDVKPEALFEVALSDFEPLQKQYKWGASLPYKLSALYKIHPSYCQRMLSQSRYTSHQVVETLEVLGKQEGSFSFSEDVLVGAFNQSLSTKKNVNTTVDKTPLENELRTVKDILVIGSGPSVERHKEAILSFIYKHKPLILTCNFNPNIPLDIEQYIVSSNMERMHRDREIMEDSSVNKIIPTNRLMANEVADIAFSSVFTYDLDIKSGVFETLTSQCVIPADVVAHYAFSIARQFASGNIFLAGFDGYLGDNKGENALNHEMEQFLYLYNKVGNQINMISITPTIYSFQQASVYYYI